MRFVSVLWLCAAVVCCLGELGCNSTTPVQPSPLTDKFSDIQKRLITPTCAAGGCHSGELPSALLNLEPAKAYSSLLNSPIQNSVALEKYKALVVPGKPDSSFMCVKIEGPAPGEGDRMPQRLDKLPQNEIDAIRSWISRGAPND